jgi:hypothetical protein
MDDGVRCEFAHEERRVTNQVGATVRAEHVMDELARAAGRGRGGRVGGADDLFRDGVDGAENIHAATVPGRQLS